MGIYNCSYRKLDNLLITPREKWEKFDACKKFLKKVFPPVIAGQLIHELAVRMEL